MTEQGRQPKSRYIGAHVDEALARQVSEKCERDDVTIAQIIRRALRKFVRGDAA